MGAAGIGAGEGEATWTSAGEEPDLSGNEGCKAFCVDIVGTGRPLVELALSSSLINSLWTQVPPPTSPLPLSPSLPSAGLEPGYEP